jgi:hypothetical protein
MTFAAPWRELSVVTSDVSDLADEGVVPVSRGTGRDAGHQQDTDEGAGHETQEAE